MLPTQFVQVPKLIGSSLEQATAQLRNLGLSLGKVMRQSRSDVPPNTVLSQSPGPAQHVRIASGIDLTVSERPKSSTDLILPISVDTSCNPQSISPGGVTMITVIARRLDGSPIPNAKVSIGAGGGSFVDSGTYNTTGTGDNNGIYRTTWKAPVPAAPAYGMGVKVMKEGFQMGEAKVRIAIQ